MTEPKTALCGRCKYELSNCPTGVCPECGTDQALKPTPAATSCELLGVSVLPALIVLVAISFFSPANAAFAMGISQNSAALGVLGLGAVFLAAHVYGVVWVATRPAQGSPRYRNAERTAGFVVLALVIDGALWWIGLIAVVGLV